MNGMLITNADNTVSNSYAIYYTINERFYVIYTCKEKDENGYVVLHIAKVLKEVNSTSEGIVPTGRFIGLEISDQDEWENAKANIGEIVSNKQNDTPVNVKYLPTEEISGINIKSSRIFKLREDIVNSIIVEETPVQLGQQPVAEEPVQSFEPVAQATEEPVQQVEPVAPTMPEPVQSFDPVTSAMPEVAPDPFAFSNVSEQTIDIPVEPEIPAEPNPYDLIQQQRDEEMINTLANDSMQDIVPEPAISVNDLENIQPEESVQSFEPVAPVTEEPVQSFEPVAPVTVEPVQSFEPTISVNDLENVQSETLVAPVAPVMPEVTPVEEEEVISSESFVDSIVADVSDILAKPEKNEEDDDFDESNYKQLYEENLEKTVELEKELKELHDKLNNIKNIIE